MWSWEEGSVSRLQWEDFLHWVCDEIWEDAPELLNLYQGKFGILEPCFIYEGDIVIWNGCSISSLTNFGTFQVIILFVLVWLLKVCVASDGSCLARVFDVMQKSLWPYILYFVLYYVLKVQGHTLLADPENTFRGH